MLYEQSFIEELKSRADIVRIVEMHVPLKKKGANWWGNCPFHGEKTPSFSVNPAKGFYKCFGCGKGGNAYSFLMEIEGLPFPEAIKRVAEISGVPLPEPVDDKRYEQNKKKRAEQKAIADQVIELNNHALEFWENAFSDTGAEATKARDYIENRGISDETRRNFRIGYAPDSWDALMSHLKSKGADEKLIEQSGLVTINEEKKRVYDRFRGRVIFPVLDVSGNPVAFGARILDKGEPKYLNSPETPAYIKGEHLYGLFQCKEEIRKKKYAILVEGYLDLIALYQAGVTNCVASLGTAFTEMQAKLLIRFARKVVVNYDGDSAGIKAARRAGEVLAAEDFEIKVLTLPNGQDPDDFIRAEGFESYKNQHKENAVSYLNFVLENSTAGRNMTMARQKAEAIEEVLPVISLIKNPIQKRESFDQAMNFLRVEDTVLKRDLWKTVKLGTHADSTAIKQTVARATKVKLTIAEQRLLEMLVHDAELRAEILPQIEETDYEELATASIFRALLSVQAQGAEPNAKNLSESVAEDAIDEDLLPLILMSEPPRDKDEAIDEVFTEAMRCLAALRAMALSRRIVEISQELVAAEQNGDAELQNRLVMEQIELARLKLDLERADLSRQTY